MNGCKLLWFVWLPGSQWGKLQQLYNDILLKWWLNEWPGQTRKKKKAQEAAKASATAVAALNAVKSTIFKVYSI